MKRILFVACGKVEHIWRAFWAGFWAAWQEVTPTVARRNVGELTVTLRCNAEQFDATMDAAIAKLVQVKLEADVLRSMGAL